MPSRRGAQSEKMLMRMEEILNLRAAVGIYRGSWPSLAVAIHPRARE